jgi:hypothetical protein
MFATSVCESTSSSTVKEWWLHEINLKTGNDVPNPPAPTNPVQITGSATGADDADDLTSGSITFAPGEVLQRSALLDAANPQTGAPSNLIYIAFGSAVPETTNPYHGWVFGYDGSLTRRIVDLR